MNRFFFILCFGFCALFSSALFVHAEDKELRIGVSFIPPLSDSDEKGNIIGPIPEMTAMVLDELKIKYKMTAYPFARGWNMMKAGTLDVFLPAGKVGERPDYCNYSEDAAYISHWGLFMQKERVGALKYETLEDFKGKSLNAVRGYWIEDKYKNYLEQNGSIEYVSSEEQNFSKLNKGRVDFVYSEYNVGRHYLKKLGLEDKIIFLDKNLLLTSNLYPLFSKKNVPMETVSKFSDAISRFLASDKKKDLFKKYNIDELILKENQITWTALPVEYFEKRNLIKK